MALTSLSQYISAHKQTIDLIRTTSISSIANNRHSMYHQASPILTQGALATANTTSGVVINGGAAGFPLIQEGSEANYYVTKINLFGDYSGIVYLQDMIYKAGTYSFNASQTLSGQPTLPRVPNSNYASLDMYIEVVTAFTGTPAFTITYTNQDGVTGRSTSFSPSFVPINFGTHIRVPLQSGDCGVQKIESVTCATATAGTFNVVIGRDLWIGRLLTITADAYIHGIDRTGAIEIFQTSALSLISQPDGGSTWKPGLSIEITNA